VSVCFRSLHPQSADVHRSLCTFVECLFPQSADVHICLVSVSAVCGTGPCAHLLVCKAHMRTLSRTPIHARTLTHLLSRPLTSAPLHTNLCQQSISHSRGGTFGTRKWEREQLEMRRIGRGGVWIQSWCHLVAMSNVDTLQTHEPSSVSARVSIYDAMSNIDTLNPAMQRRRGSRKSRGGAGGWG